MIELKEVDLILGDREIFKNFSLKVAPRERVVILGESGSGKSTLLRVIAGFQTLDSGEIYLDNRLVTKDREIVIEPSARGLNMVFQDLALWRHLTVEGNIGFGLKVKGVVKSKRDIYINKILDLVGLEGFNGRDIERLSGGEQQRVALARALVTEPKILLMDEPLSSLDSKRKEQLSDKIVELQDILGFTLLYVTHSQKEAVSIGTRVITL